MRRFALLAMAAALLGAAAPVVWELGTPPESYDVADPAKNVPLAGVTDFVAGQIVEGFHFVGTAPKGYALSLPQLTLLGTSTYGWGAGRCKAMCEATPDCAAWDFRPMNPMMTGTESSANRQCRYYASVPVLASAMLRRHDNQGSFWCNGTSPNDACALGTIPARAIKQGLQNIKPLTPAARASGAGRTLTPKP